MDTIAWTSVLGRVALSQSFDHICRDAERPAAPTRNGNLAPGPMIQGVKVTPLRQILDERGKIMHMLRRDAEGFQEFGEIYFSGVFPGAIKAWHIHDRMILNYAVPHGNIKFVLYDDRPESSTRGELQELFIGPDNYVLVTVPPRVWNGFKGIGAEMAIVANCASIPHDPAEIHRLDPFDPAIPYSWDIVHR